MAFPIPNLIKEDRVIQSEKNVQRKQECVSRGGTWTVTNAETGAGSCFVPNTTTDRTGATQQQPPTPTPEPTPLTTVPKVGGVLPDRTITDPQGNQRIQTIEETRALQGETEFKQSLDGGLSAAQGIQQQESQAAEQQRVQQIMSQLGQVGVLTSAQQASVNKSQAALSGGVGTIPGIATGVLGGALLGGKTGLIGGVPGVLLGVGIGAIGGFIAGYVGNVKKQQAGEIRAAELELTSARKIMRGMAELARQDPQRAEEYKNIYNRQLTRVHQARRQLKAEVSGDLNSWMEDGRDNLARFDLFIKEEAPFYSDKLEIALLTGGEGLTFTDEQLDEMFGVTGEEI